MITNKKSTIKNQPKNPHWNNGIKQQYIRQSQLMRVFFLNFGSQDPAHQTMSAS